MSEGIIARGQRKVKEVPFKKIILITVIIAVVIMMIGIISNISTASAEIEKHKHTKYCYKTSYRSDFNKDNAKGELKDYKMDCDYTQGAAALGMNRYSADGGLVLPMLIVIVGVTVALVKRARNKGYIVHVTADAVHVYFDEKHQEIPICSIFSVEKTDNMGLNIVTSENSHSLREMEGRDDVYAAIVGLLPTINVKGPANNEQVLAKGYPPAIKPWLLVLTIILAVFALIAAISAEEFGVLIVMLIPAAIVFVFYLLAKTPYLVVTDKRVFYVTDFGRKLSLPLNKITVVVTHWWFHQLHIAAPAGRIHLFNVRNTAELYDMITALQNEKQ